MLKCNDLKIRTVPTCNVRESLLEGGTGSNTDFKALVELYQGSVPFK